MSGTASEPGLSVARNETGWELGLSSVHCWVGIESFFFFILIELKERNYVKRGRLSPLALILYRFNGLFDEKEH